MLHLLGECVDLVADAPVHALDLGARLQIYQAVREQFQCLLAYLLRIVPVLQHRARVEVVPDFIEVLDEFVVALLGLKLFRHLGQRGRLQHVDDEYAMMGREVASAFGDKVGVGYAIFVGSLDKRVHAVVDILLDAVVDGTLAIGGSCAVVIDAQTASAIHEIYVVAHLAEVGVELRSLVEGSLYAADLRDL